MANPIPTPYEAGKDDRRTHYPTIQDADAKCEVAVVVGETKAEALATRDFIIKACNNHAKLVEHLAQVTAALQIANANLCSGMGDETLGRLYETRIAAEKFLAMC